MPIKLPLLGLFSRYLLIVLFLIGIKQLSIPAILNIAQIKLTSSYMNRNAINNKDLQESKKIFLYTKQIAVDNSISKINLGRAYLLECNFEEVRTIWNSYYHNKSDLTMFLVKWVIEQGSKFCGQEQSNKFSISMWPDFPHGYLNLGDYYFNHNQQDLAKISFFKGIKSQLAPKFEYENIRMHYMLARSYYITGDLSFAEIYFNRTIELDPTNRFLWFTNSSYVYLGDLYSKGGDYEQAIRSYLGSYSVAINDRQSQQALNHVREILDMFPNRMDLKILVDELSNK